LALSTASVALRATLHEIASRHAKDHDIGEARNAPMSGSVMNQQAVAIIYDAFSHNLGPSRRPARGSNGSGFECEADLKWWASFGGDCTEHSSAE